MIMVQASLVARHIFNYELVSKGTICEISEYLLLSAFQDISPFVLEKTKKIKRD